MRTWIKTAHEEEYSDKSRTLGVLLNYSEESNWKDSLVYIFNHESATYVFFNTIIDMIDYLLYGDKKINCAYINEEEFDQYYDAEFIEGTFTEKLTWQ